VVLLTMVGEYSIEGLDQPVTHGDGAERDKT
jgi:hypothetical protein